MIKRTLVSWKGKRSTSRVSTLYAFPVSGEIQCKSKRKRVEPKAVASLKKLEPKKKQGDTDKKGQFPTIIATQTLSQGVGNVLFASPGDGKIPKHTGNPAGQGSQEICRRVPSRQNRYKRAATYQSSSVAASPVNALDDTLYFQTPLGAGPTQGELETSEEATVKSQNQATIQASYFNSHPRDIIITAVVLLG